MRTVPSPLRAPALGAACLALVLTGCAAASDGPGQAAGEAVTVTNCGEEVVFEATPQRLVMLKSDPVTYLHPLGVLDRVVARAGAYPREYYDDETWAALEKVPALSDELDSSGHLQISKEIVLAQRPDLVLGAADNVTRETLAASDIDLLESPALCPEGLTDPTFEAVADQFREYGRVFGEPERGEELADEAMARVEEIVAGIDPDEDRTAAVLYPTVGGGTTYAYGTRSMAQPQLEAAGFTNVFGDVDERVFEVTQEELIGRNPDVIVVLHTDGDPAAAERAVTGMDGARAITAIRNGDVLVQLFNFTEPATPLTIDGLANIVEEFGR